MGVITISRGSHSGGKAVAEQLGKRLGYPVLSREQVLHLAAEEFGISEKDLAESLNQPPPTWHRALGKRLAYVKCVTAVLLEHARPGNLVYHGNVGHLLLAAIPRVLRVRVIADMETRIRSAMDVLKTGRDNAIAHIQHVDKERSKWAKVLYGVNWDSPDQYDAILNLQRVTVGGACETIVRMLELDEFKPDAASRKALSDATLGCQVWAAIAKNPAARSAGLEVKADDGTVVITGNAGSSKAIELITQTASRVDGVKNLKCEVGMGTDWYW